MAATHTKKIKHSMFCVTGVYLIDNTIFLILSWNVSHLSVCSSFFFFPFFFGVGGGGGSDSFVY